MNTASRLKEIENWLVRGIKEESTPPYPSLDTALQRLHALIADLGRETRQGWGLCIGEETDYAGNDYSLIRFYENAQPEDSEPVTITRRDGQA